MNTGQFQVLNHLHVLLLAETSAPVRFFVPTLKSFSKRQIQATVTTVFARGPLQEIVEAEGFAAYSLGCQNAWDYPRAIWRLAQLTRELNADVVLGIEPICGAIAGLAHCFLGSPKVLFHRNHVFTPLWKQTALSRLAATLAERVLCVSKASAEGALRFDRASPSKVCVVYNGTPELREVDAHEISDLRTQLGITANEKVIVMVGHLRPEKGHLTILRAMKGIQGKLGPVHLVIVGSGPCEAALKDYARECGPHIHFAGHQQDVAPWFSLADVAVMPSLREAFGLVATEAFLSRRPLIASSVGGLREVVKNEETGLLVPPSDPEALAAAVVRVLKDNRLAQRLTENAYVRGKEFFSIDAMVDGWARHCAEITPNGHRA